MMLRNSVESGSILALNQHTDLDNLRWSGGLSVGSSNGAQLPNLQNLPASSTNAMQSAMAAAAAATAQQTKLNQTNHSSNGTSTSNDVVNLQYIDLEEFLLENAVNVVHPQQSESKGIPPEDDASEKHYQVNLEQRSYDISSFPNTTVNASPPPHTRAVTPPTSSDEVAIQDSLSRTTVAGEMLIQQMSPTQPHLQRGHSLTPPPNQSHLNQHIHPNNLLRSQPQPQSQMDMRLPSIRTLSAMPHQSNSLITPDNTAMKNVLSPNSNASSTSPRVRRVSYQESSDNSVSSPNPATPDTSHFLNSDLDGEKKLRKPVKRSRKESVPEDSKDEKYWKRRAKNNEAAKRSRDLRREKENQILHRVSLLERDNQLLIQEIKSVRIENESLKKRLSRYEVV